MPRVYGRAPESTITFHLHDSPIAVTPADDHDLVKTEVSALRRSALGAATPSTGGSAA